MPFKQAGMIRYYRSDLLESEGVFHAVITRQGGVSPFPWHYLNLAESVGDKRCRVIENRELIFRAFNIQRESVYDVWQVHGDNVICTDTPRPGESPHQKADAILTNRKNIALLMLFADCVPILLYDPVNKVVGIAHAGWKGTVLEVGGKTIAQMTKCYSSDPENILAVIGPSIGPDHYSVGSEVIYEVQKAFGPAASQFLEQSNGAVKFNLWECNRWILNKAGVQSIEISHICTACHTEDWFSHRAEHGKTGRFGVVLGLIE
jgi:YfiH family protein